MKLNHYRAGHGPPLVLIHGIGSRWQIWEPVMDRLVAHRDVIALDLPGFGASPMPPAATPAGVDSLTALVAAFLRDLGVDRPHSAGNSLGGLIVLQLARSGLVRSATALSPAGFANRPEMMLARSSLWLTARAARRLAPHADAIVASRPGRALVLGQVVAHPTRVSPRDAAATVRALVGAPWFDDTLHAMRRARYAGDQPADVPVTIAWGDKDRLLLPRQARRAARAIPGARMVDLHGCGHVPTYDDPQQVARVLLEATSSSPTRGLAEANLPV